LKVKKRIIKLLASEISSPLISVEEGVIKECLENMKYETKRIRKKSNPKKFRELNIPQPPLIDLQRLILANLLYKVPVSQAAHCSIKGRSVITNAKTHRRGNSFFKIDFKDAFPSVSRIMLSRHLEYPLISKIGIERKDIVDFTNLIIALTSYKNQLPQGAPTSPYLLNIVCYKLDEEFLMLAKNNGLSYSRYADDLWFSSSYYSISKDLRILIVEKIKDYGFRLNRKKVHYRTGTAIAPRITGVTLTKEGNRRKLSVSKKYLDNCRAKIYNAAFDNEISEAEILGLMGWILMVKKRIPPRLKKPFGIFLRKRCPEKIKNYSHLF